MPLLIPITDPADPRIEAYRDIRERDLVGRERMFVAEGKVVVEKLVEASRHRPASLLIADKRVAGLTAMLGRVGDDVPVYVAAQAVIDAVAGFPLHRGILAIGRRMDDAGADALLASLGEGAATVLLLSGIANHDNMGRIYPERRRLLRSALSQGDPGIGGRRAARADDAIGARR